MFLGDVDLTTLKERHLTELRRDRIGFVFQAFNLVPTLTAEENIVLPSAIAGRRPDPAWFDEVIDTVGLRDRLGTGRASCRAASSSGSRAPGPSSGGPRWSSPTSRPATSTRRRVAEVLGFLRRVVDSHGQTVVMVTHDPGAASWTDRVVFLADGRVVEELREPTPERVLAAMARLDQPVGG